MKDWQHPWFDDSRAPLLFQRYPRDTTDEDMSAFISAVENYLEFHPKYFAWVCDLTNTLSVTATQRKMMSDFEKRTAEHDKKYCLATALVVPNRIVRGVITAIYWLSPPVYPYRFFSNLHDGEQWSRAQLATKGLSVR